MACCSSELSNHCNALWKWNGHHFYGQNKEAITWYSVILSVASGTAMPRMVMWYTAILSDTSAIVLQ